MTLIPDYSTVEWHAIRGDTFNPDRSFGVSRYLTLAETQEIDGDDAQPNSRTQVIAEVTTADGAVAAYDAYLLAAAPRMQTVLQQVQRLLKVIGDCKFSDDQGLVDMQAEVEKVLASTVPPDTELYRFTVGQIVEHKVFGGLRCGSGAYPCAVVVQADPLVLVSPEGDMMWSATTEEMRPHLRVVDSNGKILYPKAFDRWEASKSS